LLLEKPQQPISPSAPGLCHKQFGSSNLQKNPKKKIVNIHLEIKREKYMKKVKPETGNGVNEMDSISESAKVNESPIKSVFAVGAMIYGYDYVPSSSSFPCFPLQLRLRGHWNHRRKFHFSAVEFFIFHYCLHSQLLPFIFSAYTFSLISFSCRFFINHHLYSLLFYKNLLLL